MKGITDGEDLDQHTVSQPLLQIGTDFARLPTDKEMISL